jgi:uncharacterized coiled-coil DUF342 family protein
MFNTGAKIKELDYDRAEPPPTPLYVDSTDINDAISELKTVLNITYTAIKQNKKMKELKKDLLVVSNAVNVLTEKIATTERETTQHTSSLTKEDNVCILLTSEFCINIL